jgi:hypothetical protein
MHAVRKALVEVEECGRSHRVGRTHRRVICLLAPTCGGGTTEDRAQPKHPLFGTTEHAANRQCQRQKSALSVVRRSVEEASESPVWRAR